MGLYSRSLIIVFLFATSATMVSFWGPVANNFALVLDMVPFAGAVALGFVLVVQLRRTGTPVVPLIATVYSCSAGALVGMLGIAHLVGVIHKAMSGSAPFVYDFRFYSLIMLGMTLLVCGTTEAWLAPRLVRERSVWWVSMTIWCTVLLINVPLIPLQGFAILFSILAALAVIALCTVRYVDR